MSTQAIAAPPVSDTTTLLKIIAAAAADERVNVAKIHELLDAQERIMRRESEVAFNRDMLAAQELMKPVVRDAMNRAQGSRYALLETIDRQIRPIYTSHGFAMTFNTGEPRVAGAVRMVCDLRHIAGHMKPYELEGALDSTGDKGSPNKSSIKALGSSISFLRRYLTLMVWNIQLTNEDDDGDAMSALTPDQLSNITNMLNACEIKGDRMARFLEFAGAPTVEEIQRHRYSDIMTKLRTVHAGMLGR